MEAPLASAQAAPGIKRYVFGCAWYGVAMSCLLEGRADPLHTCRPHKPCLAFLFLLDEEVVLGALLPWLALPCATQGLPHRDCLPRRARQCQQQA